MPTEARNLQEMRVVPDATALNAMASEEFCHCAQAAIAARGRFCVALSGGNTPRSVYSLLAERRKDSLPWDKVYIFFGDERHVPPDHPDSNYRMAYESLLSKVPVPPSNVFRVPAELPATDAAAQYDQSIRSFFLLSEGRWPQFDLILLGLGEDGHTASLFPTSPALHEQSRLVAANWVEKFGDHRITFTFPVLNHALEVLFLVSGQAKAPILRDLFDPAMKGRYPAQAVQPVTGRVLWIADRDAAGLVGRS
jgi:6-phosphogluconolactonase